MFNSKQLLGSLFLSVLLYKVGILILGWPKSSFGFFHYMVQKNPNELFGQPNSIYRVIVKTK